MVWEFVLFSRLNFFSKHGSVIKTEGNAIWHFFLFGDSECTQFNVFPLLTICSLFSQIDFLHSLFGHLRQIKHSCQCLWFSCRIFEGKYFIRINCISPNMIMVWIIIPHFIAFLKRIYIYYSPCISKVSPLGVP